MTSKVKAADRTPALYRGLVALGLFAGACGPALVTKSAAPLSDSGEGVVQCTRCRVVDGAVEFDGLKQQGDDLSGWRIDRVEFVGCPGEVRPLGFVAVDGGKGSTYFALPCDDSDAVCLSGRTAFPTLSADAVAGCRTYRLFLSNESTGQIRSTASCAHGASAEPCPPPT